MNDIKQLLLVITSIFLESLFLNSLYGSNLNDLDIQQQNIRTITGNVKTADGEPLPGATIIAKGTSQGIVTDADGNFTLRIPAEVQILQISFIGMKTQEVNVRGKTSISVIMEEEAVALEEVVAVGYGVQKKETVTGSLAAIDTRTLVQSPVANLSNAMTGRLPGLLSVQRSGEPGADQATLRIRGDGTFSGSSDPMVMVDGIETLNYNNIDPNEIENITILKDASATAVYGVRGANGVILITTKRGTRGKPVVSLSSNVGVLNFIELRENLGSYDYALAYNEGLRYNAYVTGTTYQPRYSEEDIEHYRTGDDPIFHPNTDWISLMLNDYTTRTQHNLNIRGGSNLVNYFISAGFLSEGGLYKNTEAADSYDAKMTYERYNFRSNFDFTITPRFTANINLSSQIEYKRGPEGSTSFLLNRIMIAPPWHSPGLVDGKIVNVYEVFGGNPLELLLSTGFYKNTKNYLNSTVRLNYDLSDLIKGLGVHSTLSYWNNRLYNRTYTKSTQVYKAYRLPDANVIFAPTKRENAFGFGESSAKDRKTYLEVGLDYAGNFGDHEVTGLILYNQDKLYDPDLEYVIPNGHQGLVGRITYNYKRRYLAEFNAGYNGTENFASGKRFGFFPAYSLGWIVSEEPFFPQNKIIPYLKIRGSYGEVGNDKIGGQRFLYRPAFYTFGGTGRDNTYRFGVAGSTLQDYRTSSEGLIGNPDLTWERAKKSNIGFDMALWEDKIRITADYFNEQRNNILTTPQTVPIIVGATLPVQNWGKMKNSGYDAELNYRNNAGNFQYWVKATYTYAHNEILFQDEVKREFTYQNRTGQSKGQMFGYIVEGFYNTWEEVNNSKRPVSSHINDKIQPGDFKYKDINGDGIINSDDQVPLGYPNFPEKIYGLSLGGEYKGFDFSLLFQGATNVSRSNEATSIRPFDNDLFGSAYFTEYCWTPERYANGDPIKLPHLSAQMVDGHNYVFSSFRIQDASYLRLKNAEIGYSFNKSLCNKLRISALRIYVNANNLITWDNLFPGDDPEQLAISGDSGQYPLTRTINSGLKIEF